MTKILQMIDSLHIGGAERMAVNIAHAFCDFNIKNVLICTRNKGTLHQFLPVETSYYELNKKSVLDIPALLSLFKIIHKENPNIIHAHSSSVFWGFLITLFYPKITLIWHDHNGNRQRERNFLLKRILPSVSGAIVVNSELLRWVKKEFPKLKVKLINNFPYLPVKNEKSKTPGIVLHLANLRYPKDHLTLIEAVRILKFKTKLPFQVWCAGNDAHDDYSSFVKAKIEAYSLGNEVKILGSVTDTRSLLEQASIGVLCSESEGLPVSLLEYGLAGLPVVVTDVGQCTEVVGHGTCGKVVQPKNPESLANALMELIENPDESKQMGQAFQKHVESEYGAQNFLTNYVEFIRSLP